MMKNTARIISNGVTASQQKVRRDLCAVFEGVLHAVDPYDLVQKYVRVKGHHLSVMDSPSTLYLRIHLHQSYHL